MAQASLGSGSEERSPRTTRMAFSFRRGELETGDMLAQHLWHDEHRDHQKNMYRTSYHDMIHCRDVAVKRDMPSGYGGHIPSLRHDVLFRNTRFDDMRADLEHPHRDTHPSFWEQKAGIPSHTDNPRGARRPPTTGTVPNARVAPRWGLTFPAEEPPSFRTVPGRTTPRAVSSPANRVGIGSVGLRRLGETSPLVHTGALASAQLDGLLTKPYAPREHLSRPHM
uniref:Uncharacterized protein n=1 Tax=Noctiluca scintillans TaxID=2966 RepID=A0A7S1AMJ8_NOCSC